MAETPARIAMCSDPYGLSEHVPIDQPGELDRCFCGCDCKPVEYVRSDALDAERERSRKRGEAADKAIQACVRAIRGQMEGDPRPDSLIAEARLLLAETREGET